MRAIALYAAGRGMLSGCQAVRLSAMRWCALAIVDHGAVTTHYIPYDRLNP